MAFPPRHGRGRCPAFALQQCPPPVAPPLVLPALLSELLARSARNKAVHDADRLASYYRRNRDALAVMVDGGAGEMLRPETKAAIERWLAANPP